MSKPFLLLLCLTIHAGVSLARVRPLYNESLVWRFVPHPHRPWARGRALLVEPWQCDWFTGLDSAGLAAMTDSALINAAITGGYCVAKRGHHFVRLLSSAQARACLADESIDFAGDSYTRQLFIAMIDVLTDRPSELPLWSENRTFALRQSRIIAADLGFNVFFPCFDECYGFAPPDGRPLNPMQWCRRCLDESLPERSSQVVGLLVHLFQARGGARPLDLEEVSELVHDFLRASKQKLVWVTGVSYMREKIPFPYNLTMPIEKMATIYHRTLGTSGLIATSGNPISLVNQFEIQQACEWPNRTSDGGHAARFVDRMKAQFLLNILCRPDDEPE